MNLDIKKITFFAKHENGGASLIHIYSDKLKDFVVTAEMAKVGVAFEYNGETFKWSIETQVGWNLEDIRNHVEREIAIEREGGFAGEEAEAFT